MTTITAHPGRRPNLGRRIVATSCTDSRDVTCHPEAMTYEVTVKDVAAGPRWEVYGPHRDDPAEVWTEVYYLLA